MNNLYTRDCAALAGIEKLRFYPLEVVSGHGAILTSPSGHELLDLSATWTAAGLGHGHPAIIEAVTRAVQNPAGAGALSAAHPDAVGLAEDLLALVPGTAAERKVYLGHAGSDANDVVLRACRRATGRRTVLTFEGSYHGGLGVAMGVSGIHVASGAAADPDAIFLPYPNPYRPTANDVDDDVNACLQLAEQHLSAGSIACLIVEPILSDGGLVVPPDGFLARLQQLCRRHAVPLICDEVKMGLGRPGTLHAFEHDGIIPDVVTFGKALGGGLPLSAAVGPAELLDAPPASALLTTAGNPVCAAAGRAVLNTLVHDDLAGRAATVGAALQQGLHALQCDHIGDIRGRGMAIGVELIDPRTGRPDPRLAAHTVYRAWELGAVVFYVSGSVLEITPPLILTDAQAERAVQILGQAIIDAAAGVVDAQEVAQYAGW